MKLLKLPIIGERMAVWTVDPFEHFKSYGYSESFWKTTTTATWENHTPFVSYRVQFSCAICLGVMQLLFILRYKY